MLIIFLNLMAKIEHRKKIAYLNIINKKSNWIYSNSKLIYTFKIIHQDY